MFETQSRPLETGPVSGTPQRRRLDRPQPPQIRSFFSAFEPAKPGLFSSDHPGNPTDRPQPVQLKSHFSIRDAVSKAGGQDNPPSSMQQPVQRLSAAGGFTLAGSGPNPTGIPTPLKTKMEASSGFSLSDVQVHYHSDNPAQLQALAYTQGNQVYIGPGQEKHLPHELGHVIQQKQGLVRPTGTLNGLPLNDSPYLEHEADRLGTRASSQPASSLIQRRAVQGVVQRQVFYERLPSPYGPPVSVEGPHRSMKLYLLDKACKHGQRFIAKEWHRRPEGGWYPPTIRARVLQRDNQTALGPDEGNFAVGVAKKRGSMYVATPNGKRLQKADRVKKYAYSQANDARYLGNDYTGPSPSFANKVVYKPNPPLGIPGAPAVATQELIHTELKILESFYAQATTLWAGTGYDIYLYSERNPCDTCSQIINAFSTALPNVDLYIYYSFDHPDFPTYKAAWQTPAPQFLSGTSSESDDGDFMQDDSTISSSPQATAPSTFLDDSSESDSAGDARPAPSSFPFSRVESSDPSQVQFHWWGICNFVAQHFKSNYAFCRNDSLEQIEENLEMLFAESSNPTTCNGTRAYTPSQWIWICNNLVEDSLNKPSL